MSKEATDGYWVPECVRAYLRGCVCSIGSGPVEHLELVHVSGWF